MREPTQVRFDLLSDGQVTHSYELSGPSLRIGRLSSCQLRLAHPSVARLHAALELDGPGHATLMDLGSPGGSYVNGEPVTRAALRSGDRVRFGAVELIVSLGADLRVAPAPPAAAVAPPVPAAGSAPEPMLVSAATPPPPPHVARVAGPLTSATTWWAEQAAAIDVDDHSGRLAVELTCHWADVVQGVRHFVDGPAVTVGEGPECDYPLDAGTLGAERFPLLQRVGDRFALSFVPGLRGWLRLPDGETLALEELVASGRALPSPEVDGAFRVLLPPNAIGHLRCGPLAFDLRLVAAPRRQRYPFAWTPGLGDLGTLGATALGWALFLALAFLAVPDVEGFRLESFDRAERFISIMVAPDRREESEVPRWFQDLAAKEPEPEEQRPERGKAAEAGRPDARRDDGRRAGADPDGAVTGRPDDAAMRDRVRSRGALGALNGSLSELSALWGSSDRAVGADAVEAVGGWEGARVGAAQGHWGLASRGGRAGGEAFSEGSVGGDLLGTRGGDRRRIASRGPADLGSRPMGTPQVTRGPMHIEGTIDREIVRRVIGGHRNEVRYCYEKELARHRDLHGKVVVRFLIAPNGHTLKPRVHHSTLDNRAVHQCILQRLGRWVFPQPTNGGLVEVTYPFLFKTI